MNLRVEKRKYKFSCAEEMAAVSRVPKLFVGLICCRGSDTDFKKLAGEIILRALHQAGVIAQRLQKSRPASTARIEELEEEKAMK